MDVRSRMKMGSESCGMRSETRTDGRMWIANLCEVSLWWGDAELLIGRMQCASAMRRAVGLSVVGVGSEVLGTMVRNPFVDRKNQLRESSWQGVVWMRICSV